MAVRQYIGARYVPKFSDVNGGEWDDTYTYEPLTIVKHGNDYYTSKKEVPTGIAITNTEYWALTGNYNGAISELDDRVTAVEGDISGIDGQIEAIETSVASVSARVSRPRAERKYILIGDSYAGGYTPGETQNHGWIYHFIQDNSLTEGVNVFRSSVSGTGTSKFSLEDTEIPFVTHLTNVCEVVLPEYEIDPLDITDIIVLGGTNDIPYTSSQILAGMSAFFTYQKSHFPNAFVKVGVLAGFTDTTYDKQNKFINVIDKYQKCGEYGASYITNSEFICANKSFISADGVHPTQAGYEAIAKYTSSLANASSVDVIYNEYLESAITFSADFTQRSIPANVKLHNDTVTIWLASSNAYVALDVATPFTVALPFSIKNFTIGKLNSGLIKSVGAGRAFGFNTMAAFNSNTGSYAPNGLGYLYFDGGDMKLDAIVQTGDSTSRNYGQIFIQPTYTLPTILYCY